MGQPGSGPARESRGFAGSIPAIPTHLGAPLAEWFSTRLLSGRPRFDPEAAYVRSTGLRSSPGQSARLLSEMQQVQLLPRARTITPLAPDWTGTGLLIRTEVGSSPPGGTAE